MSIAVHIVNGVASTALRTCVAPVLVRTPMVAATVFVWLLLAATAVSVTRTSAAGPASTPPLAAFPLLFPLSLPLAFAITIGAPATRALRRGSRRRRNRVSVIRIPLIERLAHMP